MGMTDQPVRRSTLLFNQGAGFTGEYPNAVE
jgi:hypothetical protein